MDLSDHWLLTLTIAKQCPQSGDIRLMKGVKRLLAADYLSARTLTQKGRLEVRIPKTPLQGENYGPTDLIRPLCLPMAIEDSLYRYQRQGAAWLLCHPRAILADDMGLGKTAQAIRALRWLFRSGRVQWVIVVGPGTLLNNWVYEFNRWAPELVADIFMPGTSDRLKRWRNARHRAHVAVTSYDHLRVAADAIRIAHPELVIADEAHRLRTAGSATTAQFRKLDPEYLWLLTGTPIENRAEDLAVLMAVLDPGKFSPADADLHHSSLKSRVRPFILRRTKSEVLSELPPVIERNELLNLTAEQRSAYNAAVTSMRHSRNIDHLTLFNSLRSICDLDPRSGKSSKLERTIEIVETASASAEKVVIFSYLLDPLYALSKGLQSKSIDHELLTGEMSREQRSEAVASFKRDSRRTALLASMRVASEGLTLTEASIVIFINQWWNPSANLQARDRVVRIGQKRSVTVVTFTCVRTVEERIPKILAAKNLTFASLVDAMAADASALLELA